MPADTPHTGSAASLCRDCDALIAAAQARRCPVCRSPRVLTHAELFDLAIAHLDCDAFYAAVEKRDRPELADRPVIIGGGTRGVVSTACYIARIHGVRSAMPMFKALALCPDAVMIRPDMAKYAVAGKRVREIMQELTPLVQPLSIDEAFMDLSGTARLHGARPALQLVRLARKVEREVGITVSIGLSYNKYLAKVASDLSKPRGFSVIGRAEAKEFLADKPVSLIWGVGKAAQGVLEQAGITRIGQLQQTERNDLIRRFGSLGTRLYHLARGEDDRRVTIDEEAKSIGAETTFNTDIRDRAELERHLWRMAEKASRRAKTAGVIGRSVTLKLKTADFQLRTRSRTLSDPTCLATTIFEAARQMLAPETGHAAYRLIGVSLAQLEEAAAGDAETDSLDRTFARRALAERAMDRLRAKFGQAAVERGLVFTPGHEVSPGEDEDGDEAD